MADHGIEMMDREVPPPRHLDDRPPLPSHSYPGKRTGSVVYGDGAGFYYHCEKVKGQLRMLRCSEMGRMKCRARATMRLEEGAPILTFSSPMHNHEPDPSKGIKLQMMRTLKERAQQDSRSSILNIFNEEAERNPEASYSILPVHARRSMALVRNTADPDTPLTLEMMREELLRVGREDLRSTLMNTPFFIDQPIRGADGEILALGFVSQRILEHLSRHPAEASHLIMDATFKVVPRRPKRLQQFFTIHVFHMDIAVPVAFFLMRRKTEDTYWRILSMLKERFVRWDIHTVTTDFEIGLVNSVREVFPEARHVGCWFHYCQVRVMANQAGHELV